MAPMFRLRFVFDGEVMIDREVRAVESRISDLSPAWPNVVQAFRTIVRRAFDTEGRSTPNPWPQLAPRTQRQRQLQGYGAAHPILKRSGELFGSITGGGGGFVESTKDRLAIGTTDPVFWFHQSRLPRKRLPRRAMVNLTLTDRTELSRPVLNYVMGRDPNAARRPAAS
jgi:phage gpG-like protein